jgi:aminoglycoside phosphotransferase (APT) family kinase protein
VESVTKTVVDAATAAAVARDAFDGVPLAGIEELTGGGFNAAYTLLIADGRRAVMKVAPPPHVTLLRYERGLMKVEAEAMRLAASWGAPVPKVLWLDDTGTHLDSSVLVMEWCDGELMKHVRPTLSAEQQAVVDRQVAHWLRRFHEHTAHSFGLFADDAARFARWSEAFIGLYDMVIADARDAEVALPRSYDELTALPRRHADALDLVTVPRFVHWDLWDQNVFVDPATLQVTGLIDFERALWADPLMEVNFAIKGDDPAYLAEYGPIFTDDAGRLRRRLYDLYLSTVMTVESTFRQYRDPANESLGRMWLDGTLAALAG